MKILYFSSTGNCLYIAKRLGGELLSIPQLLKKGIYNISDDVVGIICPNYFGSIPNLVKQYLKNATINAEYIFAIITFGSSSVAALTQMRKLLGKRGYKLQYSNNIMMVDNYLPFFDISNELIIKKDEEIESKIDNIIKDITQKKSFLINHTLFEQCFAKIFSSIFTRKKVNKMDKNFIVNDYCNNCKICHSVCPVGNIIGNEKPEYQNKCEFCLACIHHCPKIAIHLNNEKSSIRFINQHIKLTEIINANNQK